MIIISSIRLISSIKHIIFISSYLLFIFIYLLILLNNYLFSYLFLLFYIYLNDFYTMFLPLLYYFIFFYVAIFIFTLVFSSYVLLLFLLSLIPSINLCSVAFSSISNNFKCGFYSIIIPSLRYRFNYWLILFHFLIFEQELILALLVIYGIQTLNSNWIIIMVYLISFIDLYIYSPTLIILLVFLSVLVLVDLLVLLTLFYMILIL